MQKRSFWTFKNALLICCFGVFLTVFNCEKSSENHDIPSTPNPLVLNLTAQAKYGLELHNSDGLLLIPRSSKGTIIKYAYGTDWTIGFYPGVLWQMFQISKDSTFFKAASAYTLKLKYLEDVSNTHDLGFMINNSFGKAYEITKDEAYLQVLLKAADNLAIRYNQNVKCIRSWDWGWWSYPVIIDNMMNLELLFNATQLTGNQAYQYIAVSHALTTMSNHYRADYSTYHVVDYNKEIGQVISRGNFQGFGEDSDWARGQAWGLYGFTMCYRFTKNPVFLKHADHIASFLLEHPNMSPNYIPYWDLKDPTIPNAYKDASAAAIMASAFAELFGFTNNYLYKASAIKIIDTLLEDEYFSKLGANHGFLLMHSVGNKPSGDEIDVSINYADYYFLEALQKLGYLN